MLQAVRLGILGGLLLPSLLAQDWRYLGVGQAVAYDWARGEVLAVGNSTSSLDSSGVHQRPGLFAARISALCHDPVRRRTIALNAFNSNQYGLLTFEWDGVAWVNRTSVHTPVLQRSVGNGGDPAVAVAYDSQRNHLLVFGTGQTAGQAVGQTWSWDGTDWQLLSTTGPATTNALGNPAMAFDTARGVGQLMLWGNGTQFWEWDGAQWTLRSFGVMPTTCLSMAYDPIRRRTVLKENAGATWEFDAAVAAGTWQQVSSTPTYHATIFFARDRGRIAGWDGQSLSEWNGQAWVAYMPMGPVPYWSGLRMRLHPDSGRVVAFGKFYQAGVVTGGTTEFDGFEWRIASPAVSPPSRSKHAMWNDGHDVWLFGGEDDNSFLLNDTWRWDGTNWSQVITPQTPSPRVGVAIAYDTARQRAVAFGGATSVSNQGSGTQETWEFDGATWMQQLAPAPPARSFAAAGYDPITARTMICLGDLATGYRGIDAWQWDGVQWMAAPPVNAFTWWGGQQQDLAFDPIAGRLVLAQGAGYLISVKEFTGTNWVTMPVPTLQSRDEIQLVPEKDGSLLLGSIYRRMAADSAATRFGTSCVADLLVSPRTYPKLGADSGIEVVGAPVNGPVLLLAADQAMSLPLGGGCTQVVTHTQWAFFLLADALGVARQPLTIPDDIALRGYQLNFQALTFAGQAPGFAASAGLRLTIGD